MLHQSRWLKKQEDGSSNNDETNGATDNISKENEAHDATDNDDTSDSPRDANVPSRNPTDIKALLASAMHLIQSNDVLMKYIYDSLNAIADV